MQHNAGQCEGAYSAIEIVAGKWMPSILYHLGQSDAIRFNELRRKIPDITQKVLTSHLKELEQKLVVHREVYAQVPPKVEYSLTEFGRSIMPILDSMQQWGENHREVLAQADLPMAGED